MPTIHCICQNPDCRKEFSVPPSRYKDGRGKFCSRACHFSRSEKERFWLKVNKTETCWLWTASKNPKGYGHFGVGRKIISAHIYSWLIHYGPIQGGLFVCHHCDVPFCVRPDHLFLGTNLENVHDAKRKGRLIKGEKAHSAKLSEQQIYEIRSLEGQVSMEQLGRSFRVSSQTIRAILRRTKWTHL